MKITCHCGALVSDQADALPHKGHVIADQEWFAVLDGIDRAIDELAAGRTNAEAASMKIRTIVGTASRNIYQCRQCGRLFVDDRQHQMHTFAPATAETGREVLKGGAGD